MLIKNFIYHYDEITIGSTLPALLYSFFKDIPVLSGPIQKPHDFDFFDPEIEMERELLQFFYFPVESKIQKKLVWDKLFFILSMQGLIPMSNKSSMIRINDDNVVNSITTTARMSKFKAEKLFIWSENGVRGLPLYSKRSEEIFEVFDFFNVPKFKFNLVGKSIIVDDGNHGNELFFLRETISKKQYSIVSKSILDIQELNDFIFSDVQSRFKLMKHMRDMKLSTNIEHIYREKYPIFRNEYEDTDKLIFKTETDLDTFKKYKRNSKNYQFLKGLYHAL